MNESEAMEWMNAIVEQKLRERLDRLEQEAFDFIGVGFHPSELTIVSPYDGGEPYIAVEENDGREV